MTPANNPQDFYSKLGAQHLSNVVKDDYRPISETSTDPSPTTPHAPLSVPTRSLILERLTLFLNDNTHTVQANLPSHWFDNETNFVVRTFKRIVVVKTLVVGQAGDTVPAPDRWRPGNETTVRKQQEASAVAFREVGDLEQGGAIQLWLAGNVDMYEYVN